MTLLGVCFKGPSLSDHSASTEQDDEALGPRVDTTWNGDGEASPRYTKRKTSSSTDRNDKKLKTRLMVGSRDGQTSELRQKGDEWWSSTSGDENRIPPNFTPGLIPVIRRALLLSYQQGVTKRAVLCVDGVCHISSALGFDVGWGCGYRNTEMALTALVASSPDYQSIFPLADSSGHSPGVRNLQSWIASGWDSGYDIQGKNQFKGKIVGTKKWIGTSDICAAMLAKRVECHLHDFYNTGNVDKRTASKTLIALLEFTRQYFDNGLTEPESSGNVIVSSRQPLIIQHEGHSRTIVGYEIGANGETNLLLFDPGKTMPKWLRSTGIEMWKQSQTESVADEGPDNDDMQGDESPENLRSDEEIDSKGWVRKRSTLKQSTGQWLAKTMSKSWESSPEKVLDIFRADSRKLE